MDQFDETAVYKKWLNLWTHLGAQTNPRPVYEDLIGRYAEPRRTYHTLQHILFCLKKFDSEARIEIDRWQSIPIVELALWYHDAVYDTRTNDNEEQSGRLVMQVCNNAFLPADFGPYAANLIMATRHASKPKNRNEGIVVDIDLAIFGQPESVFDEYEADTRHEYYWMPNEEFKKKRAEILQSFFDRRIYTSDCFYSRYERQAKANLERSIRALLK